MHGRPRKTPTPKDPAAAASASAAKAAALRDLQIQVLHNHRQHIYTEEARASSLKLLQVNPEVLYGWNYRKTAFQHNLAAAAGPEDLKLLVEEELKVVKIALEKNPKSYGAWYHRKWVLSQRIAPVDYAQEFKLLELLFKQDSRNFHGWSYRRFIAAMADTPEETELQYTISMIRKNFSNYSALHNRSLLLSHQLEQKPEGYKEKILKEYESVHHALFTDARDQSGWFYYFWLLDQTVNPQVLVSSSWPVAGSECVLTANGISGCYKLFPFSGCSSYYYPPSGKFPVILYFNQAVKGVNSSTITIKSLLVENEDFIWRPLLATSSEYSRCWVTYLKIRETRSSSLECSTVVISLGPSQDITNSSGSYYSHLYQLKFSIKMKHIEAEQKYAQKQLLWDCDIIYLPEESPEISFDEIKISHDQVLESSQWQMETLSNQINTLKELVDVEDDENSKYARLALARVYNGYNAVQSQSTLLLHQRIPSDQILELYDDLIKLDPSHTGYYEDERSLVLINQVTSDKESLIRHCCRFSNLDSSSYDHQVCLRLHNLSLTRIGCHLERLLWVQMLDLSHNKLRSIEGLEALQLLTCLNLSHNAISSFTMLEPLKLLISLKVLNLSYNKIGSHPVNTTKYLCSSPFSHPKNIDWSIEDFQKNNIKVADHWEAIHLFTDLRLTQLDMKGNVVAGESLSLVLRKVLPTLNWLDGKLLKE